MFAPTAKVSTQRGPVALQVLFKESGSPKPNPEGGQIVYPGKLLVMTHTGHMRRAEAVIRQPLKGKLLRISIGAEAPIECTPDQRFFVVKQGPAGETVEEAAARELEIGTPLVSPSASGSWAGKGAAKVHLGEGNANALPIATMAVEPYDGWVYNLVVKDDSSYLVQHAAVKT